MWGVTPALLSLFYGGGCQSQPAAHALLHIISRKSSQCGESLQHRCRSSTEAAAGVDQAPMHRPALEREAGQGLICRPIELHHNLQQAATSSAVSWQVMYKLGAKSVFEVKAG